MLPKRLVQSFQNIKLGKLVAGGDVSQENISDFVENLNAAIPIPSNSNAYSVYRFNRFKYSADKERFMKDIEGFQPYEAMVLWTDYTDILKYFKLTGKIFLGWDKRNNRYRAYVFNPVPAAATSTENDAETDEPVSEPVRPDSPEPKKERSIEEAFDKEVDDTTRLFEYMQKRIREANAQIAQQQ